MKKSKATTFIANGIEVLTMSHIPDGQGLVVPPEAHIKHPKTITVTYGQEDDEYTAGTATLRRSGNVLLADLVLKSVMGDPAKALKLISKMTPAVAFYVDQRVDDTILELEICEVFLTTYENEDPSILPLGNRVKILPDRKDLH
jgi:hypothetical protein